MDSRRRADFVPWAARPTGLPHASRPVGGCRVRGGKGRDRPVRRPAALRSRLCPALLAAIVLSGCSSGGDVKPPVPPVRVTKVSLTMLPDINQGWPVEVELVRVRDEALVGVLLQIDGKKWFDETGPGFRLAHPDAVFDHWEIVPGTAIGPFDIRRRGRFGGVLFCGLREPVPPVRVAHEAEVQIVVDESGCTVNGASTVDESGTGSLVDGIKGLWGGARRVLGTGR